jgi:hypothetical protein
MSLFICSLFFSDVRYGGLKKFIERHLDLFLIGADHPFSNKQTNKYDSTSTKQSNELSHILRSHIYISCWIFFFFFFV